MFELHIPILPSVFRGQIPKLALYVSIFLCAVPILDYILRKRVRRNGSVPVVGLPSGTHLKDARRRFYSDAQLMLMEGYKKVNHD